MAAVFGSPVFRSVFSRLAVCRSEVLVSRPCFSTHSSSEDDETETEVFIQSRQQKGWSGKESTEALYFRIDMPGLREEHVNVRVENNNWVVIKSQKEEDLLERVRIYSERSERLISLEEGIFSTDEMIGEMKDGVLKLIIPKLKKEETQEEPKLVQVPIQ